MGQWSHAHPVDQARGLRRVIQRDHREVIAPMAFSPVLRPLVRVKGPDVPRADAEDVGHAADRSAVC